MSMPRFRGLAALLKKTAEETAKRKDVADEAVNKTGVPFLLGGVQTSADAAQSTAAAALPKAGGTLSGQVSQPTDPTSSSHLSRKGYVDAQVSTRIANSSNAVTRSHIEDNAVVSRNVDASLKNPSTSTHGLRLLSGSGGSVSGSSSDHVHSIPFKNLPLETQEGILAVRKNVREAPGTGQVSRAEYDNMKALVMTLCVLLFDDEEYTAEETHSLLKSDPEFLASYEKQFLHDYGDGPEPRRKGRFSRQEHPDIGRFVRRPGV